VTQLMFAAKIDLMHSILAMIFSNIHPRPDFHIMIIIAIYESFEKNLFHVPRYPDDLFPFTGFGSHGLLDDVCSDGVNF